MKLYKPVLSTVLNAALPWVAFCLDAPLVDILLVAIAANVVNAAYWLIWYLTNKPTEPNAA